MNSEVHDKVVYIRNTVQILSKLTVHGSILLQQWPAAIAVHVSFFVRWYCWVEMTFYKDYASINLLIN